MKEIQLNNEISINLPKLIDTRLLVQANSGAGKSWLLRRILEQSHGKVQQIIIDLEGEFSTLREKYDYVVAGKGGDTPATPQSAALLARKLLELNVSAIIDLYELPHQDRKRFVRLFLDSMINAPKELWHPCMVVIDEAHVFVPEKGESEAAEAVIDLATRGRKRGFCVILATQRISKLHKDAAAECNNKLIGRAAQDIDMKRSSDELGFTSREQQLSLRSLDSGEFYAFGPAISNEVIKLKVGEVKTSHPKSGSRSLTETVPPTERIKKILEKLADLPEEAKKEARTLEEMRTEIRTLKQHRCPKVNSKDDIDRAVKVAVSNQEKIWSRGQVERIKPLEQYAHDLLKLIKDAAVKASMMRMPVYTSIGKIPMAEIKPVSFPMKIPVPVKLSNGLTGIGIQTVPSDEFQNETRIVGGALRMLKVLVSRHPIKLTRSQLATFSKLSPNSGTFGTYLSSLKSKQYIFTEGDLFSATPEGIDFVGEAPNPPQTTEEIIDMWKNNLTGGFRRMFEALVQNHPTELSKNDLGYATGLSASSGTFGTYMSILRSNGLIKVSRDGMIGLSDSLFI